jgi:hypothetical protein
LLLEQKIEVNYFSSATGLAVSAFVQFDSGRILLVDPGLSSGETRDVENLCAVLSTRYSAVKIVLSTDLWRNFERTAKEVVQFFRN